MSLLDKNNENERQRYEDFVSHHTNGSFTQSLMWPDAKNGWDYEAIMIEENGKIKGTALVLIKKIPFAGTDLLYCPRGPVCDYTDADTLNKIVAEIAELAKKYNAYECIMDPFITRDNIEAQKVFEATGYVCDYEAKEGTTVQIRDNYIKKIGGMTAEEVFNSWDRKCRYNTRLSMKSGVKCERCGTDKLDEFYELMKTTGERDGFTTRGREYFDTFMNALGEHCCLFMCYYEGKPISGAIAVSYGGKTMQVYGASSNEHRNVRPNNTMQLELQTWAVEQGSYIYDFGGIPHWQEEDHPAYGMYAFKKTFNGEVVQFVGEYKFTFSKVKKKLVDSMEKCYKLLRG